MKENGLEHEVFTQPVLDGAIVYIPRCQVVIAVDERTAETVNQLLDGQTDPPAEAGEWEEILTGLIEEARLSDITERQLSEPFQPSDIMLSLTSRCPLRCVYCFARAGERVRDLPRPIIERALEMAAGNARLKQRKSFHVAFHGEGEPTANWPLFTWAVERAEHHSQMSDVDLELSMSTNAIWGKARSRFVTQHFSRLSVSLDGGRDVQNALRPTANGFGSFDMVMDSLKALADAGVEYGIRATVTPETVSEIPAFIAFVAESTTTDTLALEPVFANGRGEALEFDAPSFYEHFTHEFLAAKILAKKYDLDLEYSGCRPGVANRHFCRATGPEPNFAVMTNGVVSSCYEITDSDSARGNFTIYGHWCDETGDFIIDEEKLDRIRRFDVTKIPRCCNCFAQWNCGGDCVARSDGVLKADTRAVSSSLPPRCLLNRKTTLEALVQAAAVVDGAAKMVEQP